MNELIRRFSNDRIMWWGIILSLGIVVINSSYLLLIFRDLPPFVPLFNQMPWGEERIAQKIDIFLPLFMVGAILLGNVLFSYIIYEKMTLVARILSITSLLAGIITLIFLVKTSLLLL